jgi:hypothetical protein
VKVSSTFSLFYEIEKNKRSNFSFSVVIIGWLDPHTIFYLCFCIVQVTGLGIAET